MPPVPHGLNGAEAIIILVLILVFGLIGLYIKKRADKAAESQLLNQVNLIQIKEHKEELIKLQTASIRDSETFKQMKEAYDAKWKATNVARLPDPKPSTDDGTSH